MTQPSTLDLHHQVALRLSREEDCDCIENGLVIVQLQALHEEQQVKCKGTGKVTVWPLRVACPWSSRVSYRIKSSGGWEPSKHPKNHKTCHGLGWVDCTDMATLIDCLLQAPGVESIIFDVLGCVIHILRKGKPPLFWHGADLWQATLKWLESREEMSDEPATV